MGPRDDSLSYHYWLSHLAKDQEFVAPGTGDDAYAQYIDVRDVANWIIECAEQARPGIYNTVSEPLLFRGFLSESASAIGGKGKPVWVNGDYLREQHVKTFDNMPYWNPDRPDGCPTLQKMPGHRIKKLCHPISFIRKNNTGSNGASRLSARFSPPGKTNKLVSCSRGR
jgi:hypothetical protein